MARCNSEIKWVLIVLTVETKARDGQEMLPQSIPRPPSRNIIRFKGNDQEIEFHEIEIGVFHEIKSFYNILHNCSGDQKGTRGSLFQGFFLWLNLTLPNLTTNLI